MARNKLDIFNILKGVLVATIVALLGTLALSLIATFTEMDTALLPTIGAIIRLSAVFIGVSVAIRQNEKGFLKGLIASILYVLFSYLVFSLIDGEFSFDYVLLLECGLTILFGSIAGGIIVNIRA